MENDSANLLNEEFDVMLEELREQWQIKDIPYVRKEKDELVDIVGNIAGKIYHNCSAYGEKGDISKNFKQGDFVKIFGQLRTSADDSGKEHRSINILSSRLLKAKEQKNEVYISKETKKLEKDMKDSKRAEKESVRKTINKYKDENKKTAKSKKKIIKEMREKYFIY